MRLTTSFLFAIFVCGVMISANLNFANAVTFKDYDDAVTAGKKLVVKGAPRGDGEDLDALLFKPVNAGPYPALIALHGAGGIFPYQLWWAREISKLGYVVLFIDHYCTRGYLCEHASDDTDQRRGTIMRNWQQVDPKQRVMDAIAGYIWLSNKNYVKKDKIGLIGWSWGGSSAMFAQKLARRLSLPNGGFKATISFYPNLKYVIDKPQWERTGPIEQPLLILYGKDDILESDEAYKVLQSSGFPAPIKIFGFEGAYRKFDELGDYRTKYHPAIGDFPKAFDKKSFERSVTEVKNFLTEYLN